VSHFSILHYANKLDLVLERETSTKYSNSPYTPSERKEYFTNITGQCLFSLMLFYEIKLTLNTVQCY